MIALFVYCRKNNINVTYLHKFKYNLGNKYAVQQNTQSFLMIEFIHHMLARHVSDLTGPSSGAFYKLYLQILYVL